MTELRSDARSVPVPVSGSPEVLRTAPLTAGQTRLWFADRLDPGDPAYNMPAVRRLSGPLDADALERAFDDLVRRHEILRTVYTDGPDGPVQLVLGHRPFALRRIDVSDTSDAPDVRDVPDAPADRRDEAARAAVRVRTNQRLDLEHGPVLDVTLIRLAADDHVLCVVLHHIAGDGWSVELLFQEIGLGYARQLGHAVDAPRDLAEQYADIAVSQQKDLAGPDADEALAHWSARLADCPVLDLPTDRQRPPIRDSDGRTLTVVLDAALTANLRQLAQSQRCTMFMTVLAAYEILLARHADQDDVTIGSPVSGRSTVAHESLIGYFVNTVVFRSDLHDDPTFRQHLRRVRTDALGALTHAAVPYERLLDVLDVPRDPSRTALYQAMFALHAQSPAEPDDGTDFPGLTITEFDAEFHQSKTDLLLDVWDDGDTMACAFTYATSLWQEATIRRLAERFIVVLEAVAADPDLPVGRIPLVRSEELERLDAFAIGPEPADSTDQPRGVLAAIEATVRTSADHRALSAGSDSLTYGELWTRAGVLASRLIDAGAGADRIVALCLPKGMDLIVAMLATWRAGAAYLPLDPEAPASRNAAIVAASGATAIVAHEVPFASDATLVPPEQHSVADSVAALPDSADLDQDALAYVIYTSGSTGEPKGVAIPHRAVAARVRWMAAHYGITPEDRVLQFAATTFDTHVEEVFPTLASGACLILPTDSGAALPEFLDTPHADALTILDLPTALWHELVALDDVRWPPHLRLLIIGGDQASAAALTAWRSRFGNRVPVVNTYGPTETTVIATAAWLDGTSTGPGDDDSGRLPIGSPIGHTTARVLDRHGERVPVGVPGILHIGGAGLARGYVGAPGATAERFRPDPFGPPGSRLYDTGDRVLIRPDGQLVFLGRTDHQVKIRGFRVEPAEVEAALTGHRRIAQAAVLVRGEGTERRLVAYAVPEAGAEPTSRELRGYLAERLPAYLVPAAVAVIPRLPLTAHGKLDVRALPPAEDFGRDPNEFVPCEPGAEELVAGIFAELFGRERVGATDDFFDLGGHSLAAMRAIGRIRAATGVAVPMKTLFAEPTVRAVAAEVTRLVLAEVDGLTDDEVLAQLAALDGGDDADVADNAHGAESDRR